MSKRANKKLEEPVRQRIIDSAESLMLLQGFNGTSVDQICANARITKGAFFHYFKSKDDLASKLLKSYWAQTLANLKESGYIDAKDPMSRLLGAISFFESIFTIPKRPSACLIGNFTQEAALVNESIRVTCDEIFNDWIHILSDLSKQIVASRAIKRKVDHKGIAELIVATVEGAFLLVKATGDDKLSKRTLGHLRKYLEQVFAP